MIQFASRLSLLVALLIASTAFALSGNLIPESEIIPQLCRVEFVSGEICSGSIVGKNVVVLAEHCGVLINKNSVNRKLGQVRCYGEPRALEFKQINRMSADFITKVTGKQFVNGVLPKASDNSPLENSSYDVVTVTVNGEFKSQPLELAQPEQTKEILNALWKPSACRIYGVGINPTGTLGMAHGVNAPLYRGAVGIANPIELNGDSGVAPMDSGGPLACNIDGKMTLVGVTSRGNGQAASTALDHLKNQNVVSFFAYVGDPAVSLWLTSVVVENNRRLHSTLVQD